jgi:hypothetical protein
MNLRPQYAKILAETARKIIQQEEFEARPQIVCQKCEATDTCRCPTFDPIPPLGIKDVLVSAGYNPTDLASELDVCANCFEPYDGPPFESGSLVFCCRTCAEGGDCTCEQDRAVVSEFPEGQADQPSEHYKVNSLWSDSKQSTEIKGEGFPGKYNRLWSEERGAELSSTVRHNQPKTNAYWQP